MTHENKSFALLRRNIATADEVTRILRLPDDRWAGIELHWGTDELATVKVEMFVSPEQLVELAKLAADIGGASSNT